MTKQVLMAATVPSMIGQFNMNNITMLQEMGYKVNVVADLEREIEGFNIEAFKTYIGFREYDTENGVLYSHTIDEVKDFFMQFRIADEATEIL